MSTLVCRSRATASLVGHFAAENPRRPLPGTVASSFKPQERYKNRQTYVQIFSDLIFGPRGTLPQRFRTLSWMPCPELEDKRSQPTIRVGVVQEWLYLAWKKPKTFLNWLEIFILVRSSDPVSFKILTDFKVEWSLTTRSR